MTISPEERRVPRFGLEHRLALARAISGLKQMEMAEVLGTSHGSVSNYENGKTRPSKLQINAWAVATGVDVEWLKTGKAQSDDDPRGGNSQPSDYNAHVLKLAKARRDAEATALQRRAEPLDTAA